MKKLLANLFLIFLTLLITGCTLLEGKTFTMALRDGVFYGKTGNDTEIYIEFDSISIMEYVKRKKGNYVKDLSTKEEKFYSPYYVQMILTKGINNTKIKFDNMIAMNLNTTTTYKLSNITDDGTYDIKIFNVELVDHNNDKIVDTLNLHIERKLLTDDIELKYLPGSGSSEHQDESKINFSLEYDENLTVDGAYTDKTNTIYAGYDLTLYVKTKGEDASPIMYVNNQEYGTGTLTRYGVEDCYKFEYITGYTNVEIKFKEAKL